MALHLALLAAVLVSTAAQSSDPSYDHQTSTYVSSFVPVNESSSIYLTPFFSPEHSTDTLVNLIQQVKLGGKIDIATPGFDSWGKANCTYGPEGGCIGCTISQMIQEPFPIFPAILNAIHQQKAVVRVVINDYNQPTCPKMISPLDYWALNGVQIVFYTTTTFMHAKYMRVETDEGDVTAVSSINYSQSSFTENREAGMLINETTAAGAAMAAFTTQVFDYDFQNGNVYTVTNTYSSSEMAQIMSTAAYPVNVPAPNIPGSYITPTPYPIHVSSSNAIYTAPDFSREQVELDFSGATSSIEIYIYQITDNSFCQSLLNMNNQGINVTLLVSHAIYDETDWKLAQACYTIMYNGGMEIRKSPRYYEFSHNKFWIVDGDKVRMSTGNMSPSDYPTGMSFPPYSASGWQNTNRDFTIKATSTELAAFFRTVMTNDWANGEDWAPYAAEFPFM